MQFQDVTLGFISEDQLQRKIHSIIPKGWSVEVNVVVKGGLDEWIIVIYDGPVNVAKPPVITHYASSVSLLSYLLRILWDDIEEVLAKKRAGVS